MPKKSSVQTHKREKGKERLKQKMDIEMDIAKALKVYDEGHHPVT